MLSPGPAVALDGPGLIVDVIGSIVISLSRCCLANDEGAAPQYFFLEPPLKISLKGAWSHHVTHFKFLDP